MEDDDYKLSSKAGAAPQYIGTFITSCISIATQYSRHPKSAKKRTKVFDNHSGYSFSIQFEENPQVLQAGMFALIPLWSILLQTFNCNANIVVDEEYGAIMQLQGDKRKEVAEFFVHEGIADKEHVRVHGT